MQEFETVTGWGWAAVHSSQMLPMVLHCRLESHSITWKQLAVCYSLDNTRAFILHLWQFTYHFFGAVRGLYFWYFTFHSIVSLQRAHTPPITRELSEFACLLLPWRSLRKVLAFWYFWPFFLASPLRVVMLRSRDLTRDFPCLIRWKAVRMILRFWILIKSL